jgi:hypothetical protein
MISKPDRLGLIGLTALALLVVAVFFILAYRAHPKTITQEASDFDIMRANVGVVCDTDAINRYDYLVAFIAGADAEAVKKIKAYIDQDPVQNLVLANENDLVYAPLKGYTKQKEAIQEHFVWPNSWIAWWVNIKVGEATTIMVPTLFGKHHATRLFVVGLQPQYSDANPTLDYVNRSVDKPNGDVKLIFQAEFSPEKPQTPVQNATIKARFFGSSICGSKQKA